MITCPKCRKELPDGTKFCKFCVNPLVQTNIQSVQNTTLQPTTLPTPQKKKKSSKKIIIAVIAILLTLIIALGAIFIPKFLESKKEKEMEEKFTEIIKESTTKPIIEMNTKDYDSDGKYEAYVIVGEIVEEDEEHPEFKDSDIYFVNEKEAQPIKENISGQTNGYIELNEITYISIEIYIDSEDESKSFIYTAQGEESVESDISGKYSDVHQDGNKVVGTDEHGEEVEVASNEVNGSASNGSTSEIVKKIKSSKVSDIIEFGSYPQTQVTDSELIEKLNEQHLDWISYGYYIGTGGYYSGQMKPGDYMKYADFTYNEVKYRAVTFSQYRPYETDASNSSDYSEQDDNGYYTNTTYYFKYAPLKWRILDPEKGLIMCENIIDSQSYNDTNYYSLYEDDSDYSYFQDTTCTTYANNYAASSIRSWLNSNFYNVAFTTSEKNEISKSSQNNSFSKSESSKSEFDSKTTNDKIFLLSYRESHNTSYGLLNEKSRKAKGTDYAKCQGLPVHNSQGSLDHGNSCWWLRSSGDYSGSANGINVYSDLSHGTGYEPLVNTNLGVRPALKIAM